MTHKNAPTATVHVVRRAIYVNGPKIERHDISIGSVLPWRISKRMSAAHRIGLEFMEGLTGFTGTGTHDAHSLVPRGVRWTGKGWD